MIPEVGAISAALSADIPVCLWGSPGTGKTAALLALARQEGASVVTLIGPTMDPTEISGVMYPADGALRRSPPDWAQALATMVQAGRPAWLFLDELSCALPAVQAALLRVVHERQAGSVDIRGCRVIAAANPADSAADGGWLAPAMAARFLHLPWAPDVGAWCAGEIGGWSVARDARHASASVLVAAWIQRSPGALSPTPPAGQDSRGWPNPRAWSAVARLLAALGSPAQALATRSGILGVDGLVGSAAGNELRTFVASLDLPDPESLLSGSGTLPTRGDQIAICLSGVVGAALSDHPLREQRIAKAWRILARSRPDLAVIPARALVGASPDVPDEARALAARLRTAQAVVK